MSAQTNSLPAARSFAYDSSANGSVDRRARL